MSLTPLQQRFVDEYLVDLNATAAYQRAGYRARGNSAEVNAGRLLRNAQIAEAVRERRLAQQQRTALTADEVIEGLRREAAFTGEGSTHSARVAALSWLGKHLAMFVDKVQHGGGVIVQTLHGVEGEDITGERGPELPPPGSGG